MEGTFRRRRLPHWDVPGATFFVTTCLHDSLPARGRAAIARLRRELELKPPSAKLSKHDWDHARGIRVFRETDRWLDSEPGSRWLSDSRLAEAVRDCVYHFAGERYDVFAYVVMPSHLHWAFRPTVGFERSLEGGDQSPREFITGSLNRWTARECNRLLGRRGQFWQHESYDHWARDDRELFWIVEYIESNPVKVGLSPTPQEFPFSSAHDRKLRGIEHGLPLRPPPVESL